MQQHSVAAAVEGTVGEQKYTMCLGLKAVCHISLSSSWTKCKRKTTESSRQRADNRFICVQCMRLPQHEHSLPVCSAVVAHEDKVATSIFERRTDRADTGRLSSNLKQLLVDYFCEM
jgi:hypothetical protein